MPNTKRPSRMLSSIATLVAIAAGWPFGRLTVPVQSLMLLRDVGEARQEHDRVRDRLGDVGDVLADVGLREAEPVGEDDRVPVLLERLHVVALRRVHRHREVAELDRHSSPFVAETTRTRPL